MVKGFLKGLVREVCSLLGLGAGGWAAYHFSPTLAVLIKPLLPLAHGVSIILAFVLILITSGILAWFAGHLLTAACNLVLMGGVNRAAGTALGLLEGALLLCMVLSAGSGPSVPATVRTTIEASSAAGPFIFCGRELLAGWQAFRKVTTGPEPEKP